MSSLFQNSMEMMIHVQFIEDSVKKLCFCFVRAALENNLGIRQCRRKCRGKLTLLQQKKMPKRKNYILASRAAPAEVLWNHTSAKYE